MKKPPFPSQQQILEQFVCDPVAGTILHRDSLADATYDQGSGYRLVCISRYGFLAHRIMWMATYGEEPRMLDHINGIRSDNRIANLRAATNEQNARNKRVNKTSRSSIKGVGFKKGKWRARIYVDGKYITLGSFRYIENAAHAYAVAARRHHGEFARP